MLIIHGDIACIVETILDEYVQWRHHQLQLYNTFYPDKDD